MYEEQQQIYWYPGLYLQPQHLQSIDLHHSYMLARHRQLMQPYNYGYYSLEINSDLLSENVFKIERLKAVLQSGYYIEYPGNCVISDKYLTDICGHEGTTTLWLALKRFNPNQINVSGNVNGGRIYSRWLCNETDVSMRDIYSDSPDVVTEISRLKYDVCIFTDEEKKHSSDFEFLPLARVAFNNCKLSVIQDFCIPALTLVASDALYKKASDIISELLFHKSKLNESVRTRRENVQETVDTTFILCSLHRSLPVLSLYLNEQHFHPWLFFITLIQLAGEISVFSRGKDISPLDYQYNHYNQLSCYSTVYNNIRKVLEQFSAEKIMYRLFTPDSSGILTCDLKEISNDERFTYYLKLSSALSGSAIRKNILSDVKTGPLSYIQVIIHHALPGIPLFELNDDHYDAWKCNNSMLLKIDEKSLLWEQAKNEGNLFFYCYHCPDDLKVELVLNPQISQQKGDVL